MLLVRSGMDRLVSVVTCRRLRHRIGGTGHHPEVPGARRPAVKMAASQPRFQARASAGAGRPPVPLLWHCHPRPYHNSIVSSMTVRVSAHPLGTRKRVPRGGAYSLASSLVRKASRDASPPARGNDASVAPPCRQCDPFALAARFPASVCCAVSGRRSCARTAARAAARSCPPRRAPAAACFPAAPLL